MTTTATPTLDSLAADLDGRLVRPTDSDWDTARLAWHLAVDQRPVAVVLAETVRDIVATVDAARHLGLHVAPQSTGHNAAPLELDHTILLKTAAMRGVQIDPVAQIARIEAGAWWLDVTEAAAEFGLAALAGSSRDVGVAGYTLGGGMSWLARSHGLAANSVVALEVVTADGEHRRVDATHDPELFWALRGGGGSFGVVTHIELRLFAMTEIYAGVLFYPVERATEVLQAWREWLPATPEAVTSVGRILKFPPIPDLPPHLSGRSFVVVEAACQLPPEDADALLAPLRALGPELDTFRRTPMTELSLLHMDPEGPVPGHGDGMLLGEVGEAGIEAFVRISEATGPALLSFELRQLGGAAGRPDPAGGVTNHFDAAYAMFAVGITPTPEIAAAVKGAVTAAKQALSPWSTGGAYLNFSESRRTAVELFGGAATAHRLERVKGIYDPADVLRSNHPVTPRR